MMSKQKRVAEEIQDGTSPRARGCQVCSHPLDVDAETANGDKAPDDKKGNNDESGALFFRCISIDRSTRERDVCVRAHECSRC